MCRFCAKCRCEFGNSRHERSNVDEQRQDESRRIVEMQSVGRCVWMCGCVENANVSMRCQNDPIEMISVGLRGRVANENMRGQRLYSWMYRRLCVVWRRMCNVATAITYLLDDAERWKKKRLFDIDTSLTSNDDARTLTLTRSHALSLWRATASVDSSTHARSPALTLQTYDSIGTWLPACQSIGFAWSLVPGLGREQAWPSVSQPTSTLLDLTASLEPQLQFASVLRPFMKFGGSNLPRPRSRGCFTSPYKIVI